MNMPCHYIDVLFFPDLSNLILSHIVLKRNRFICLFVYLFILKVSIDICASCRCINSN